MRLMKALTLGLLGGIVSCGFLSLTGLALPKHEHQMETKLTPRPMFEVVDDYKGCDVIRYTDHEGCVHFFIHCGPEK